MNHDHTVPDLTAVLDQTQMACRMMAKTSHAYLMELIVAGFTRDESLTMVLLWQESMLSDDDDR